VFYFTCNHGNKRVCSEVALYCQFVIYTVKNLIQYSDNSVEGQSGPPRNFH